MHERACADATGGQPHACQNGQALARLVQADRLDEALSQRLIDFQACPDCPGPVVALLSATQQRLLAAWAARDRHRQRQARLQRLADLRRQPAKAPAASATTALPPAAAAALARARARASGIGRE